MAAPLPAITPKSRRSRNELLKPINIGFAPKGSITTSIEAGKIIQRLNLIDEKGEKVGRVKNIQSENKSVEEATEEMEVAVSIPGVNFERQMKNRNFIYSDISELQFKNLKKNKDLLSQKEIKLLEEIAGIKCPPHILLCPSLIILIYPV